MRIRISVDARALITSNFEIKWFQIAVGHEQSALEARDRAVAAAPGTDEMARAFDDELRSAMVVIAAAAFAIDALHLTINDLLQPATRSRAKRRVGRILETFKTALDLGDRTQRWQTEIPALFAHRGNLVHFRGEPHETGPHRTGKSNVSLENVTFTAEEATRAVELALEVLTVGYSSPRKEHEAVVRWAASAAHIPAWLDVERSSHP